MTPKSLPLDEFLRDPEAGRIQLKEGGLVVLRADDYQAVLDELECTRFAASVRAGFGSLDRGLGIDLDDLQAQFDAEDAAAQRAEATSSEHAA